MQAILLKLLLGWSHDQPPLGAAAPQADAVSLNDFVNRLKLGFDCDDAAFVVAAIYAFRLHCAVHISTFSIRNVAIGTLSLANKFLYDSQLTSRDLQANCVTMTPTELTACEDSIIKLLNWNLFVGEREYREFHLMMTRLCPVPKPSPLDAFSCSRVGPFGGFSLAAPATCAHCGMWASEEWVCATCSLLLKLPSNQPQSQPQSQSQQSHAVPPGWGPRDFENQDMSDFISVSEGPQQSRLSQLKAPSKPCDTEHDLFAMDTRADNCDLDTDVPPPLASFGQSLFDTVPLPNDQSAFFQNKNNTNTNRAPVSDEWASFINFTNVDFATWPSAVFPSQ